MRILLFNSQSKKLFSVLVFVILISSTVISADASSPHVANAMVKEPSSVFAKGQYALVTDYDGYTVADVASSGINSNSFSTPSLYPVIGGVAVSGFSPYTKSYARLSGPGAPSVSDTFTVTNPGSLVAVVAVGGDGQILPLSGIPNLKIDAASPNDHTSNALTIAHTTPDPGNYTITGHTLQSAAGRDSDHTGDSIGVRVFNPATTAAPTVTGVLPATGPTAGGTVVTISGTGFTGATGVKFGSNAATSVRVVSAHKITATSPKGPARTVDITVTTAGGTSAAGTADKYTYVTPPTITGISPSSGTTLGGTEVTITGTGFTGATGVKFGSKAATNVRVASAHKITATTPAGDPRAVNIMVTTPGGTATGTGVYTYTIINFQVFWITDTQHLSRDHPDNFTQLTTWIANAAKKPNTYNLQMVVHTGDIVDNWDNESQWSNANNSLSILSKNNISYSWDAGNHDCNNEVCKIGYRYYRGNNSSAFDPLKVSKIESQNWVDSYNNGEDTAVNFTVGGLEFLIVNIGYNGDQSVLDWANRTLAAHSQAYALVATHTFINATGGYEEDFASRLNDSVLAKNPNVFITLNGHHSTYSGYHKNADAGGRIITELMFDRQDCENNTGATAVTILNFTIKHNPASVHVDTFDNNYGTFSPPGRNNYTFTTPLPSQWIR